MSEAVNCWKCRFRIEPKYGPDCLIAANEAERIEKLKKAMSFGECEDYKPNCGDCRRFHQKESGGIDCITCRYDDRKPMLFYNNFLEKEGEK